MMLATRLSGFVGLALLAAAPSASARAEGASGLQPFQMVRSLQVVQDRIAGGDHAIMPMQRKILELIDGRLRGGGKEDFADPRNLRALLVYAMSGGNPATIGIVLSRLSLDGRDGEIGKGVLNYLNGQTEEARVALAPIEPMTLPADLGAFVALVKGSVIAADDPEGALKLFDQARLLGPGTLIEEGALRRAIGLAATLGDAGRFALASTQYAASYLRSPYASQFADSFVSGVVALHEPLDTATIGAITSMMDAEQERVIYLRIARRAGIDGFNELSAFASAKAENTARSEGDGEDPRALLYASLASVTSGTSDEIGAKLGKIDRSKLSQSDRDLFDAVAEVAAKLTATPPALTAEAAPLPPPEMPAPADDEPLVIEADPMPADPMPQQATEAAPDIEPAQKADAAPAPDPADQVVAETRKKLDEIDKLLGDVQ